MSVTGYKFEFCRNFAYFVDFGANNCPYSLY